MYVNIYHTRKYNISLQSSTIKLRVHLYSIHTVLPPVASAPSNLMAVQEGPTSVRVSWSPPTPLGDTTGYRISYSGASSGSVDVSGGSTDTYLLTGLQSGASYTISIVGSSEHFCSVSLELEVTLGEITELQYACGAEIQ